jgi:protease I
MKALVISANNFEDIELLVPYYWLREEGIDVEVASLHKESLKATGTMAVDKRCLKSSRRVRVARAAGGKGA